MGLIEIKEARVEDFFGRDVRLVGLDDLRIRIQTSDDLARRVNFIRDTTP